MRPHTKQIIFVPIGPMYGIFGPTFATKIQLNVDIGKLQTIYSSYGVAKKQVHTGLMIYVLLMIGVLGSNGFELLGIEISLKLKNAMMDCEETMESETCETGTQVPIGVLGQNKRVLRVREIEDMRVSNWK